MSLGSTTIGSHLSLLTWFLQFTLGWRWLEEQYEICQTKGPPGFSLGANSFAFLNILLQLGLLWCRWLLEAWECSKWVGGCPLGDTLLMVHGIQYNCPLMRVSWLIPSPRSCLHQSRWAQTRDPSCQVKSMLCCALVNKHSFLIFQRWYKISTIIRCHVVWKSIVQRRECLNRVAFWVILDESKEWQSLYAHC